MDVKDKKIKLLLIGCTGFLGGRLIEKLHSTNNYDLNVTSNSFSGNGLARAAKFSVKLISANILDTDSLDKAMKNIDVVINGSYIKGSSESIKKSILGTENLLEVAIKHDVKQFIQISSASVFEPDDTLIKDEKNSFIKKPDDYVKTKLKTEECVKQHVLSKSNTNMKYTIIRPTRIYGPYSAYWTERLIEGIAQRKKLLINDFKDNPSNFVYVDDVCDAISICILNEKAYNNDFNINGEKSLTWEVLLSGLQSVVNKNLELQSCDYEEIKLIEKDRVRKILPNALNSIKKALLSNESMNIFRNDLLLSSLYRSLYGRFRKSEKGLSYTPKKQGIRIEDYSFLDKFFVKDMKAPTYISSEKINNILGFKNNHNFDEAIIEIESWNKFFSRKNYMLKELYKTLK